MQPNCVAKNKTAASCLVLLGACSAAAIADPVKQRGTTDCASQLTLYKDLLFYICRVDHRMMQQLLMPFGRILSALYNMGIGTKVWVIGASPLPFRILLLTTVAWVTTLSR